ncbi:MAG: 3D-(3,5/4)-trihydroxycyclohexane-1,2-dione acylhydrolase (decyclizing) [Deltaproteobacteria bacterium]|nr:3D-(3,5/4)-trihydroxycyclohexane-1,2-dione acylhydrolase (decyclizing) [Deltaproteobacteria bacterium]
MSTIRLTAAQALVRYLTAQTNEDGERFVAGVWAIFGHGNVAGLGEALYRAGDALPTWRGHNEQGMAHAAIAFAKASNRKRAMAVTSSIGPGATNMVTAAAVAHVNRLPVLFLPGDVFANRLPDPVLQQVEDFADGTVSANDCFRPVSRYFDRITRPEQLLTALPRAMATLIDPAACGPVTLALCQDVQAEAYDYPEAFFEPRTWIMRRQRPDARELERGAQALRAAKAPLIIAGGGVHYSDACETLAAFAERRGIPVAETQAGKSALPWTHPCSVGAIGVTGAESANAIARTADLILAVGTRLQDFTTGSWSLFQNPDARLLTINAAAFDATKHGAVAVVGDARTTLEELDEALGDRVFAPPGEGLKADWDRAAEAVTAAAGDDALPTDAQVIGAVQRNMSDNGIVVCAAGGLPGELHKLWRSPRRGDYHLEYGYSCMGYEIAGGLGVKMARPNADVVVVVGDGSYMMLNSELATSVMLGLKLTVVVLDNRGFGCINRLQLATGGASFNNLLDTARHQTPSAIDFAAHAASMGAIATHVDGIESLEAALAEARSAERTSVIVIDTDARAGTQAGGHWWDVAVPEVSDRAEVTAARESYEAALKKRR